MQNKYSIQYNENTKEFSVESQRLESTYSYKTPEQFIKEKGVILSDKLNSQLITPLAKEYIQNQIVNVDEKLLNTLVNEINIFNKKYHYEMIYQDLKDLLVRYADQSGSPKLKFVVDLWQKD